MEKTYIRKVTKSHTNGNDYSVNIPREIARILGFNKSHVKIKFDGESITLTKVKWIEEN